MMKYGCSASFDAQFASVSSSTSQERPRQANMSLWPAKAKVGRRNSKEGCMVLCYFGDAVARLVLLDDAVARLLFDAAFVQLLFASLAM